MYVKSGRALQVPVALEVSRSGTGAHAWVFFISPVPAETARRLGTGLLREAMSLRGRMSLASYDRLFPSQDLLPSGGVGNLIAAPLFKPARDKGATLFLDTETLEPYKDQWAYLSTLGRMTPQEVRRAADKAGKPAVAAEVTRLLTPGSTEIRQRAPEVLHARLGAGIRVEQAEQTPGLASTLRHAASMHNPLFYERQRMRASTWNISRFLHSYDETLDGGLVLPRGMLGTVTSLAAEAGSRLEITDERATRTAQEFNCAAVLTSAQRQAVAELAGFNGNVGYWDPLNTPAWDTDPHHETPAPLVAAFLTFPSDASRLMSGSCIIRDRRAVFPDHAAGVRASGTLFRRSLDLLTWGFSPG
jgi:TOTE conflict system, Archaeo-Eukaryotic Primase domain